MRTILRSALVRELLAQYIMHTILGRRISGYTIVRRKKSTDSLCQNLWQYEYTHASSEDDDKAYS
jgi:hypothetical protein